MKHKHLLVALLLLVALALAACAGTEGPLVQKALLDLKVQLDPPGLKDLPEGRDPGPQALDGSLPSQSLPEAPVAARDPVAGGREAGEEAQVGLGASIPLGM